MTPAARLRKHWALALGVAVLVVGVIAWRTTRDPNHADAALAPTAPVKNVPAATPSASMPANLPAPPVTPDPERGIDGLSHDDPLTAYRKANVYPPTSRPLSIEQTDLLQPNQRHEHMRPTDADDGVSFLFTADRYFVIGDETVTATLDVRRDGKPIAVTITQAFATVLDPVKHDEHPIPLTFTAQATRFAPATLQLDRQSAIGMYVEFDYGGAKQRGHFDFQYTPSKGIPARFTGKFRDTLDAGSLVIHASIDVVRAGHYVIDCNLFDADDHPVAWSRFKGELAGGTREAALLFFGKVIVDAKARPPLHIGQLRGARFDPGHDPDLEQLPPFTGSFTTQPYTLDQFSDAEYDSPEKQHMIQLLGADTAHRGAAGHGDPGSPGDGH